MLDNPWHVIAFLAAGFILPRIPVVGKFFSVVNTALHEFGHALVALLTGGQVRKIELFQDTSGTTTTQSSGRFPAFLVSLAGYPFAASAAWITFYMIQHGAALGVVLGLSILFLLMLIFWVRNIYGVVWVLLFCLLNGYLVYRGNELFISYAAFFYAVMILTESISSSFVILVLSFRDGNKAGDATNLAKNTHIPAFLWGLLFLFYTGWVSYRVFLMLQPTLSLLFR